MGRRGNKSSHNLDLMLNLSPPSQAYYDVREGVAGSSSEIVAIAAVRSLYMSPRESHASSMTEVGIDETKKAGMVLVGCQRCMMYLMLSESDLKCPKCKSNSLLCFNSRNT